MVERKESWFSVTHICATKQDYGSFVNAVWQKKIRGCFSLNKDWRRVMIIYMCYFYSIVLFFLFLTHFVLRIHLLLIVYHKANST